VINEASIINLLHNYFPTFIGDDAAVLPLDDTNLQLISKDLLIEDVHFRTHYFSPVNLAKKALHVNLSDIAAMGGEPQYILCGIGIPESQANYAQKFLSCLAKLCLSKNLHLIGGDTIKSPDKFFISITIIGKINYKYIKYRHTAQPNDYVCVAGNLGHAQVGFKQCEHALLPIRSIYKKAFLQPEAKIDEGKWLASNSGITSMMDISDGLWLDLQKLCQASQASALINLENIHISSSFKKACDSLDCDPLETILSGGEDYALLFTVNPLQYSNIHTMFLDHFGYPIQMIGRLMTGQGVTLQYQGKEKIINLNLFTHFNEAI
jgi:thiamine-monophosphate kinase